MGREWARTLEAAVWRLQCRQNQLHLGQADKRMVNGCPLERICRCGRKRKKNTTEVKDMQSLEA
jgi:hypothetical protein